MAQFYEGIGVVGAPAASSELAYLRPIRQGQAIVGNSATTVDVYDSALTANSLIVVTIGLTGAGAVSTQTTVSARIEPNVKFTAVIGTATGAAATQVVNWAILKY